MRMAVISTRIDALRTVPKNLGMDLKELEICEKIQTIQTTVLLRTARILRKVLVSWGDLLSLKLQWKTS